MSKSVPFPRSSLIEAISMSAPEKPMPMPSASKKDRNGLFLLAKLSALAKMMQFTTISGKKMPRLTYIAGK